MAVSAKKKTVTAKKSAKKATKAPSTKAALVKCGQWKAWLNKMPPATPTLHVTGVCYAPTPGYKIKLVQAVPQGINPRILLLKKVVTKLPGIWPQVVTKIEVKYSKKTKTDYTHVTILPDNVTVKVQIVV